MSRSLALRAAAHARLTVIIVAAVLAGAAGGAWATGVAPSPVQILTVADQSETPSEESGTAEEKADKTEKAERSEKADEADDAGKAEKAGKPEKADKAEKLDKAERAEGAQGVHGACVSAVAKDKDAIGGKNDNHGGAVSKAAHDCPR